MDYRDWGRGDLARHERRSIDSWSDTGRDPILGTAYPPAEEDDLRPVGRYRHEEPASGQYGGAPDVDDDGLVPSGPYAPTAPTFRTPSRRRGADRDDAERYIPAWASVDGEERDRSRSVIAEPTAEVRSVRSSIAEPTAEVRSVRSSIAEPTAEVSTVRRGRHREPDPDPGTGSFPYGVGRRARDTGDGPAAAGGRGRRRRADDEEIGSGAVSGRAMVPTPVGEPDVTPEPTRRRRRRAVDDQGGEVDGRSGRFIDSKSWETSAERPLADSAEIAQWIRSPDPDRKRGGSDDIDRWWDRTADPEEWARPAREWMDQDRSTRDPAGRELSTRNRPERPAGSARSRRTGVSGHATAGEVDQALDSRWEDHTSTFFRDSELFRDRDRERDPDPPRWTSDVGTVQRDAYSGDRDTGTVYRAGGYRDPGSGSRDGGTPYRDGASYRTGGTDHRSGGTDYRGDSTDHRDAGRDFPDRYEELSSEGRRAGTGESWGRTTETRGWDRFTDTGQWDRFTDTTEWDRSELARIDPEALEDRYWPDREEGFWSGTRLAGDDPRWMDTPRSAPRSPAVAYPGVEPVRERPSGPARGVRPDPGLRGDARSGVAPRPGVATRSAVAPRPGVTSRPGTAARSGAAVRSGTTSWAAGQDGSARRGFGSAGLGSSRRLQDDLLDPNPGGPFLAVLYAAAWYAVPVLVFMVWLLTLDTSVPAGCVTDVTGGGCDSERARALELVVSAAPRFGTALASSLVCAVLLRWWGSTWRVGSVGLAAAVVGGGISTVLWSVISGQPIGG